MTHPSSIPSVKTHPPALPLSDVQDAASAAESPDNGDPTEELSLGEQFRSSAAISYYISAGIHIVAFAVMAAAFAFIASSISDEPDLPPIQASLDDFDRDDDVAQFEEVGRIEMGRPSSLTSEQKLSNFLQQSDAGKMASILEDSMPSLQSEGVMGSADDDDFKFRVPKSGRAVTKGSFTAWTVPESPLPGQPYRIIIQIKLPGRIKVYSLNDLRGRVVGTDEYEQHIPYDARTRFAVAYTNAEKKEVIIRNRNERVDVRNNKVQLVVTVPGAERLVKDTITLKSRRLREDQELTLVFGTGKKTDN